MHNANMCTLTLSRPQKTSRPGRNFLFGMAARSGLKVKTYRTPMLTTQAQYGGRISTRCHIATKLIRESERMADVTTPFSKPYGQAPSLKFLYAWTCRSLSSTNSLFFGILCSLVRRRISILGANRLLPPHARTPAVVFADKSGVDIGTRDGQVLYFISPFPLFQCLNP